MKKTNAIRILETQGIAFQIKTYDVNLEDLSATSVATKIGIEPGRLMKTLVVHGRRGHYFAVIPADLELDLKAMAMLTDDRDLALAPQREIQELTGYVRGGVTVLAAKKAFPVYLDLKALDHDQISVSAGIRGQQVLLAPSDYVQMVASKLATIAKAPAPPREHRVAGVHAR